MGAPVEFEGTDHLKQALAEIEAGTSKAYILCEVEETETSFIVKNSAYNASPRERIAAARSLVNADPFETITNENEIEARAHAIGAMELIKDVNTDLASLMTKVENFLCAQ